MNAARVLARAEAAGISFRVEDGAVRMEADAPPSDSLLMALRQYREDVAFLLAIRHALQNPGPMDHDTEEARAMAAFYTAPVSPDPVTVRWHRDDLDEWLGV
jgi:hypothetical protein